MPDPEFDLYLSLLSRFLRLKPAQRDEIADELRDDLEQRLEEFAAAGLSREAAIRAALDELGDAAELAKHFTHLAQVRRRRLIMRLTFGTVAALCAVALLATAFWPAHPQAPMPNVADAGKPREFQAKRNAAPETPNVADAAVNAEAPVPGEFAGDKSTRARWVVPLKHVPAVQMAQALSGYFQGDSRVKIIAEPISNSLLINFPPEVRAELEATVRDLDHPPVRLAVEVTIVEFPVNAPGDGPPELRAPFAASYFEGPAGEVRDKLQQLTAAGKARRFKRFRIHGLENQVTQCQDNKAGNIEPGGTVRGENSVNSGTTIQYTSRVGDDRSLTMELVIHDWPGPAPGQTPKRGAKEKENGDARVTSGQALTDNYLGTIYVPGGQAVVASSIEHQTANGPTQIIYIVSAEVADPRVLRDQAAADAGTATPAAAD